MTAPASLNVTTNQDMPLPNYQDFTHKLPLLSEFPSV